MPNIKNTNQVVINNNIKAQDELKILSKLSKMGLLKTQKKRAPRQAPQMIPQAPEVGRTAPIAFDRTGSQEALTRAAIEEVTRRRQFVKRDLENDVRMTNQGSQDIPQDIMSVDVAPDSTNTFTDEGDDMSTLTTEPEDETQSTEIVREQEQDVPEQRPRGPQNLVTIGEQDWINDIQESNDALLEQEVKAINEIIKEYNLSEDEAYDITESIKENPNNIANLETFYEKRPSKKLKGILLKYKDKLDAVDRARERYEKARQEGFTQTVSQARPQGARPQGAREAVSFSQLRQSEQMFNQPNPQSRINI